MVLNLHHCENLRKISAIKPYGIRGRQLNYLLWLQVIFLREIKRNPEGGNWQVGYCSVLLWCSFGGVSWEVCCFENQEKKNYKLEVLCERCPVFLECDGAASSACDCFSPISKRNKALTVVLWLHLPPQLMNSCLFESPFFPPSFSLCQGVTHLWTVELWEVPGK